MPIKKADLEKKWYFRGAKVFFWIVQTMVLISAFYTKEEINIFIVFDIVLGFAIYWAIMVGLWKGFLYIAFGGVEKEPQSNNESTN